MECNEKVSDNIRAERCRNKYSQQEISEYLNISRETYVKYEKSAENISPYFLSLLAKKFNCKIDDFFVGINTTICGDEKEN